MGAGGSAHHPHPQEGVVSPPTRSRKMTTRRKASDASLQQILRDPVILDAFKGFMETRFVESLLMFWWEVDHLLKLPVETSANVSKEKAATIFVHYLAPDAPCRVQLDEITCDTIAKALGVKSDLSPEECKVDRLKVVTNKDSTVKLQKAFYDAHEKVFFTLKFEHMPGFLVSDHFSKLQKSHSAFAETDQGDDNLEAHVERRRTVAHAYTADIDLNYCIVDPTANSFLRDYLYSAEAFKKLSYHHGYEVLEFIQQIQTFRNTSEDTQRTKRLKLIVQRFGNAQLELPLFDSFVLNVTKNPMKMDKPDSEILEDIKKEAINKLDKEVYNGFKESTFFGLLRISLSQVSLPGMPNNEKSVEVLAQYAKDREVKQEQQEIQSVVKHDMDSVLIDSLGLHFFKKFCQEHFQEEAILFWIETKDFKNGETSHIESAVGSEVDAELNATTPRTVHSKEEWLLHRAERICKKYIEANSPLQINISASMRNEILSKLSSPHLNMFDEAIHEVHKLLVQNLWIDFEKSKYFEIWKNKKLAKQTLKSHQQHTFKVAHVQQAAQTTNDRRGHRATFQGKKVSRTNENEPARDVGTFPRVSVSK